VGGNCRNYRKYRSDKLNTALITGYDIEYYADLNEMFQN
jgi:hypothetical protein